MPLPDDHPRYGQRERSSDAGLRSWLPIIAAVFGFLLTCMIGMLTWWMVTIWNDQQEDRKAIAQLQSDVAVSKNTDATNGNLSNRIGALEIKASVMQSEVDGHTAMHGDIERRIRSLEQHQLAYQQEYSDLQVRVQRLERKTR